MYGLTFFSRTWRHVHAATNNYTEITRGSASMSINEHAQSRFDWLCPADRPAEQRRYIRSTKYKLYSQLNKEILA